MKKLLTAALVGASMIAMTAPAQAVTLISFDNSSGVNKYVLQATFFATDPGAGLVVLDGLPGPLQGAGFLPANGAFEIEYQFNVPSGGWLTATGGSVATNVSTDVDFTLLTGVYLNGVVGVTENEPGSVGASIFRWQDADGDGQDDVVAAVGNPQKLVLKGVQLGNGNTNGGRILGSVDFMVPEPSTWALMILGFGMVGASMRSRRRGVVAA